MEQDFISSLVKSKSVKEELREAFLSDDSVGLSEGIKLNRDQVAQLDVDAIIPDGKDEMRADNLSFSRHTFRGDGAPFSKEASKMAKLITDPYKLVRRAKAIVKKWGTDEYNGENVWLPFRDRLREMGFTPEQIQIIAEYN